MGCSKYESTIWKLGTLSELERNGMLEIKVMGDSAEESTYGVDQESSAVVVVL